MFGSAKRQALSVEEEDDPVANAAPGHGPAHDILDLSVAKGRAVHIERNRTPRPECRFHRIKEGVFEATPRHRTDCINPMAKRLDQLASKIGGFALVRLARMHHANQNENLT